MAKTIGIDLGTNNSAAAVMVEGRPAIVPATEGASAGGKAFPSVVAFDRDGNLLVGEPAKRQAATNPDNTVAAAKRKMGAEYAFGMRGKGYKPQQISSFILQKIKRDAEAFTGDRVEKAVIAVPAHFDDNQRRATKDAGAMAGLDVVRIISESAAASLAYGLDKTAEDLRMMVFDLGGGMLDVAILEMAGGTFGVMGTSGDAHLGGTDMDRALVAHVVDEFRRREGADLTGDSTAMTRVREAGERAKIELSTAMETEINLPFIAHDVNGPKNLEVRLTRAKMEELVRPIVERCRRSVERAMADAGVDASDISRTVLVGGPTRMPIVKKFVAGMMGKEPKAGVDPMEAVAMGAAIQAGIITGDARSDMVLLDVMPLTLGVETLGGVREPLIKRNTTIPTSKSKIFTTAEDNQTAVTIHVVQGEGPMASDNASLGSFNLSGLPPAPRGAHQIEVKFDIDTNGTINVTAKDTGTKKAANITIGSSSKTDDRNATEKIPEGPECGATCPPQPSTDSDDAERVTPTGNDEATSRDESVESMPPNVLDELVRKMFDEYERVKKTADKRLQRELTMEFMRAGSVKSVIDSHPSIPEETVKRHIRTPLRLPASLRLRNEEGLHADPQISLQIALFAVNLHDWDGEGDGVDALRTAEWISGHLAATANVDQPKDPSRTHREDLPPPPSKDRVPAPIAVWIAVATLHRERGIGREFSVGDIMGRVGEQNLCTASESTIMTNITSHCVANSPTTAKNVYRMTYRVGHGSYRLYRMDDPHHRTRKSRPVAPLPFQLPAEYRDLRRWYDTEYCAPGR